ncbi:MAG: response regulator [Fidelibacterota bacterium]|nr:MAG: response regulator [Candidatus Neomarinimicrobiota bacterium]
MLGTKRILIVDSDTDAVQECSSLLANEGYLVDTCRCITHAVQIIEGTRIDCVIMAVELEDIKGYDAVGIIKAINPSIEVILTARNNTKELEARVRAQDIFYYHIKSFTSDELIMAVNNLFKAEMPGENMNRKSQPKILVIDDDHDFLESMRAILEASSYLFVSADNPKEGMKKVLSENPDLILLDIMMDSLFDGFSMCHNIKTDKEYRDHHRTPIIFVSAVKEIAGSRFAFDPGSCGHVGPNGYLDKPIKPDELLDSIKMLLEKYPRQDHGQ